MVVTKTSAKLINTFRTNIVKVLFTFGLSVCVILILGKSLSEFVAEKIYEIQEIHPSEETRNNAYKSAFRLNFRNADGAEYNLLIDIFGNQLNNNLGETSYENQPFKVASLSFKNNKEENFYYVVLWPRICNNNGCRFDFVDFSAARILGSTFGINIRGSDEFLGGKRIFVDTAGALIYWRDDGYVREGDS